jgi:hypothetical protein
MDAPIGARKVEEVQPTHLAGDPRPPRRFPGQVEPPHRLVRAPRSDVVEGALLPDRVRDYWRTGLPLEILIVLVGILMILLVWPF